MHDGDSSRWLAALSAYHYHKALHPKDDFQYQKTLQFHPDASLRGAEVYCFNPSVDGDFFDFGYYRPADQNYEEMHFDHSYTDTTANQWISVIYEQDGGIPLPHNCSVQISGLNDSLGFNRYLVPSQKLVNQYKDYALQRSFSVRDTQKPPVPDIGSCTELISSEYEITECLSRPDNLYRITWIDSTMAEGKANVTVETHDYYYTTHVNAFGHTVVQEQNFNGSYISEIHRQKADRFPVYQREIRRNGETKDTLYQMEMRSEKVGKHRAYTFTIHDRAPKKPEAGDTKIPITHREIKVRTNESGRIVRLHATGHTAQGHKLEFACKRMGRRTKVTTDKRILPEISGTRVYDLLSSHIPSPERLFYDRATSERKTERRARKRPAPPLPFDINPRSAVLEKNRKELYRKIVTPQLPHVS